MSKLKKKIGTLLCLLMACSSVVFAFDGDDAQNRVQEMYPGAMIMDIQYVDVEEGTGIAVVFHSQKIEPSTIVFSEETGEILSQDVRYRHY